MRAPHTTAAANAIIARRNLMGNSYVIALRDGSMDVERFRRSQEQFFFAVTFFPRPMAALVGRISEPSRRLDILRNLVEEHGNFDESAFHHSTFRAFLGRLGCDVSALDGLALCPEVRAFNSVLTTACVLDELEVGIACMGIIELAFAGISGGIGMAVVDRGWLPAERMIHYRLHAELDERHAEEFFAVIEDAWDDPTRRYFIEQGLELGAYAFDRLYRDLA
ncbi:hypothetical protein LBMAG53_13710 [Planctomycetota bacterium]|nr:hypothetical protein LBMAG53_13710 [Planctomycetota bacterium]